MLLVDLLVFALPVQKKATPQIVENKDKRFIAVFGPSPKNSGIAGRLIYSDYWYTPFGVLLITPMILLITILFFRVTLHL